MATRQHALFRLVERPNADVAKGGCYVYGTASAGIDTGVGIDYEGTLFLSLAAVREMAEVAGFSVNEEGQALEIENAHLTVERDELIARVQELEADAQVVGSLLARAAAKKS